MSEKPSLVSGSTEGVQWGTGISLFLHRPHAAPPKPQHKENELAVLEPAVSPPGQAPGLHLRLLTPRPGLVTEEVLMNTE